MLLRNKDSEKEKTDYLADWPALYYDIPTGVMRKEYLEKAASLGLASSADACRKRLCGKRFFSRNSSGTVDAFLYAWMMIKASGAAGVSPFQKKRLKRELETYMTDLCLLHYEPENEEERNILTEEWQDFARYYISSCAGSKSYCSTLFGFVPIKDSTVAEKIAAEILAVTQEYPAKLGCADAFAPFRQVMCDTYCQMIEDGESYLSRMQRNA